MATKQQRAQAIMDAMLNAPATPAHFLRVGDAFASAFGQPGAALTNAQKSELLLRKVREYIVGVVQRVEGEQAASTAMTTKTAEVAAGFTEAP
ncbi:MAG: hypothetical protein M3R16_06780 [Pseudomonadota bacterium]|nr:hypothetical protein [Pseudomonadota bacterium]